MVIFLLFWIKKNEFNIKNIVKDLFYPYRYRERWALIFSPCLKWVIKRNYLTD